MLLIYMIFLYTYLFIFLVPKVHNFFFFLAAKKRFSPLSTGISKTVRNGLRELEHSWKRGLLKNTEKGRK